MSDISQTGATLSGSCPSVTGNVTERGFVYGLSESSLTSLVKSSTAADEFSASISGLASNTTYYYRAYVKVQGTGSYSTTEKTFYGTDIKSFTTTGAVSTWLSFYEMPATNASAVSESNTPYEGRYCHEIFSETFGSTKACRYNTSNSNQKVVTHTYEYNSKVIRNYSFLYDKTYKAALWVAYATSNSGDFKDNDVSRNEAWGYDPALDQSWQPNLSSSYSSAGGLSYDRGHQVASNDRQTTVEQNKQTFYYSNMTPQYGSLNQGQWATFESKVQGVATVTTGRDTLYVVTGPLFEGTLASTTDSNGASCTLPTGYWKCLMKCSFDSSGVMTGAVGCAYLVDTNSENVAPTATTIDAIESRTGFDFFANVPASLQNSAESQTYSFF
ncbi:MAG: DNA/RNA non-specific endonuclease [Candidatus Cryptobacteroides sp.]